ncbi:glycoside hydrolase family 3 protein [Gemmiger formicilis]|uniref:glycoside hydrolase family 3 protein n=2 Tax=Gemmiger formicilis TaxID=745368 RepID=UPI00399B6C44
MTNQILIGQRLVAGFPGTAITPELVQVIRQYKIGNIILFRENISDAAQLRTLCADLTELIRRETGYDPFIMVDQEGGVVTRLSEDCVNVPGAMALASTGDPGNTYLAGKLTGAELRRLGINFDLAPSVDVNCNPANPIIGVRSYGDTPSTVVKYATGMIRGLQDGGVLCLAKHFPGHGDTSMDSHLTLPCVDKPRTELEKMELAPFRAVIDDGVPAIMTAHILFPTLDDSGVPATMSRRIVTDLLRGEMGFTGLVTSDCMEMQAVQKFFGTVNGVLAAMNAGVDLVLISHTTRLSGEAAAAAAEAPCGRPP